MPTVQCNGADLYYEEAGEGQPIVCLHGVTAGLRFFEPQVAELSNRYRPIAVDFRGHGRSEKTDHGHSVPQYARDIDAFLNHLGLDDVILVGWSMGAFVTWEYIDQFGTDGVRAIVDVDMEPTRFQWDDYDHGTHGFEELRDFVVDTHAEHLQEINEATDGLLNEPPSPELRKTMFDELSRCPPPIQKTISFDCTFRDYRDVLSALNIPMLVCIGTDEKWRSVASIKYAAELAPDATIELFEYSGHCPTLEEPEKFNRIVSDYIDSV